MRGYQGIIGSSGQSGRLGRSPIAAFGRLAAILPLLLAVVAATGCLRRTPDEVPPGTAVADTGPDGKGVWAIQPGEVAGTAAVASAVGAPQASSASGQPKAAADSVARRVELDISSVPEEAGAALAKASKDAIDRFEELYQVIYPEGWVHRRARVQDARHEVVAGSEAPKVVVQVVFLDVFSVVHPRRDDAAKDEDLYPHLPSATLDEMLKSPIANPERQPVEILLTYELRDGNWYRADYDVTAIKPRDIQWLDQLGVP